MDEMICAGARPARAAFIVAGFLLGFVGATGCTTVPSGHAAVVTSPWSGVRPEPLGEGVSWSGLAHVDVLDLRAQEQREDLKALAADGAPVQANASVVTWHIVPDELVAFDREVGPDAYARIVRPVVQSAVRRVLSRYTGFELMNSANVPEIQRAITEVAASHARPMHLIIDGVLIRSIVVTSAGLGAEIVATARMEQQVLQMVHDIEIARAEGEALRERGRAQVSAHATVAPTLTPEALEHTANDAWTALVTSRDTNVVVAPAGPYVLEIAP